MNTQKNLKEPYLYFGRVRVDQLFVVGTVDEGFRSLRKISFSESGNAITSSGEVTTIPTGEVVLRYHPAYDDFFSPSVETGGRVLPISRMADKLPEKVDIRVG